MPKNQKTWKNRFLREFWVYLLNGKVNFYDFLGQITYNQYLKVGKNIFPKTCSIFEKKSTLQNLKFLKNPFFDFHKIQNLSSQRPKLSAPQSSATRSDLFGQGKQFNQNFCIYFEERRLESKKKLKGRLQNKKRVTRVTLGKKVGR